MTDRDAILRTYDFNLNYARMLVEDVPEEKMADQPAANGHAVPNHAAWVIGHIAFSGNFFGGMLLGAKPACPPEWKELFGNGSKPVTDRARYPDKATLLKALEQMHANVADAYRNADEATLAKPTPVEGLAGPFPTVGELVAFGLTAHDATHLGQLSAWRRAMGLPSVFG
jgi:DinB superfamily